MLVSGPIFDAALDLTRFLEVAGGPGTFTAGGGNHTAARLFLLARWPAFHDAGTAAEDHCGRLVQRAAASCCAGKRGHISPLHQAGPTQLSRRRPAPAAAPRQRRHLSSCCDAPDGRRRRGRNDGHRHLLDARPRSLRKIRYSGPSPSAASRRASGPATTGIDKSYKLQMNI